MESLLLFSGGYGGGFGGHGGYGGYGGKCFSG